MNRNINFGLTAFVFITFSCHTMKTKTNTNMQVTAVKETQEAIQEISNINDKKLQTMPSETVEILNNPLVRKSTLQYQAPEFDKVQDKDFEPAFEYGLKLHDKEVSEIANNPAPATFQNTLVALELSGQALRRAQSVFYNLTSSNTNQALQDLEEKYAPIFAAHSDEMYLNTKLWDRIKSIDASQLQGEDKKLLEYYKQNFEIAGADLNATDKEKLKAINQKLASLSTNYGNLLLAGRKAGGLLISDVTELDGLSSDDIEAAAANAKNAGHEGQYLIALQNTTQQPALQNLKNRSTREKLFKASWLRAQKNDENDTRSTIAQLAKYRLEKAKILGKSSFAAWKLQDQMAQSPAAAINLMKQIADPAQATAAREATDIQALIKQQGEQFQVEPWDWNFYQEQIRKMKYDLDQNTVNSYFEVTTVLEKGVFFAAEKFYGLTFKKRPDLPVYHPDVVAYEVFDQDGKSLAIYYLDFYTRDNKSGGAWMNNFVDQSYLLDQKPVIVNVFNYSKPAPGKPSLISYDDVTTMFHEFGHSIHGMFANQKYPSLSGTAVPRDFVEFPSQINEHFALYPDVLRNYALHYQTQQVIPQTLVDKLKKAANFNQGYMTTELVSAAMLDMDWHTVTDSNQLIPVLDFETQSLNKNKFTLSSVPPRYHTPYFAHIWGGGYSAGYYAYLWSETLDNDAWEWIVQNGGMTRDNGNRFRKYILSVGNSVDLNQAFRDFTGHNPDIKPLLRSRGFIK